MGVCSFCFVNETDSWFGSYCEKCHRLQRTIHLFGTDKVCSIVNKVLIVDESKQEEKVNIEIARELISKEISLKKKKKGKDKSVNTEEIKEV